MQIQLSSEVTELRNKIQRMEDQEQQQKSEIQRLRDQIPIYSRRLFIIYTHLKHLIILII